MKKIIIFLLLILNFLNADISQYFPKLEGRVIDEANLLSPEVKKDINNILKNEENKSSNQIVVVILNSLNGYSIEEFSYQLGRFWGIGQKDKNNGVLLVVSMKEREIRIEVGYGLEGALTDKISHEIINYTIKPNFKASQYELGILKAVNEIIKATQGEYVAKPKNTDFNSFFNITVPLGFFTLIFVSMLMNGISRKLKNQVLYKITNSSMSSSFFGFFTYVASQPFVSYSLILALIIFVVVFIFNYINTKKVDFDKLSKIDYINSSKNSSSFGSFDSSTSGGFSGGGGSFGGGGASGRW
ncbi:TPM domain-containing protein [Aliarcobacter butzleri]|uniref:TPM domain-containing protein n=1 Tax=Aliarcobacter butzleri TaxID=28197 RepID=UPI00263DFA41|nr:TPM domain-containing protein [Aliarcobacter butzleri]MDN5077567.1 TPM domain-containing protein [Aliarcobacter butzleri]MDN5118683.1 TPM domain-containing protein [Aliarcobacter butzleri]